MQYFLWISRRISRVSNPVYLHPARAQGEEAKSRSRRKSIAVLVPAYNEELTIRNCIDAMAGLRYSNYEIMIINDGSKDGTLSALDELLDLEPCTRSADSKLNYKPIKGFYRSNRYRHIYVIDKVNGGKADSLNAGIDHAASDIVITLDADSMLEADSLKYVNQYFHDNDIIALGGTVKIVQGAVRTRTGPSLRSFAEEGSSRARSSIIRTASTFANSRNRILIPSL